MDLLRGYRVIRGFKLRGGFPRIFSPPKWQNYVSDCQKLSKCKNVLKVFYHHAKCCEAQMSPAAMAAKKVEFSLSVCHAFEGQFGTQFCHEGTEVEKNDFDIDTVG